MPTIHRSLLVVILMVASWTPMAASAISDAQHDAINHLGGLNGMALHCKFYDETRRMKEAMVANVPKIRALGALFEDTTNAGFMKALESNQPCPSAAEFAQQVSAGIERLRGSFAE